MKTPHHIRRPGSRRPPARRALSPASGPRQSRSSCKHHPGKILDHETQTDGEESGQRLPPVSSSTRTAGHAEDGRPPGGRLAFVKGHLRTQGGLLRATGGDRRATSREEVGGVIHVSDDALSIWSRRTLPSSPGDRRANVRRGDDSGDTMAAHTPHAPHMGGSWERLVRSIKVALSATLHTRAPKDEVLHTLLLEAEFVVNSTAHTYRSSRVTHGADPESFPAGRCSGRDGCENTSPRCRDVTSGQGRPPIKVGDAVVITDPPYHVTRGRGHRRTGLPRDRRASASGGHSHGPWTAETTNCAPGGPAYRSGVVARSDRGGLLTAELRPPCAAVAASAD
ncbi:hypothetical protein EVAR_38384_1 [Eumeta japonica]|uniref:Uncharacterized protein n=1 Tax=Eumeta variegata TaxID=151549 RepID=A0A4C1YG22_EUMVA|nr:hypothetical protein EVAR_38384_1 [Eumeta japonica]